MNDQLLGGKPTAQPTKKLEVFENPNKKRDFHIHMQIPEFTCLCPKTGQPDFATLYLDYIPDERCVELKSIKLYIWSFRVIKNLQQFQYEYLTLSLKDKMT